eukprot:UC1_evm2s1557
MSRRKGAAKKGGQKHQNREVFKAGKYGESKRMASIRTEPTEGVCLRCKEQIDWRKKYNKYKPRSTPGSCTRCGLKKVLQNYRTICPGCATQFNVCEKCGNGDSELIEREMTAEERRQHEQAEQRKLAGMRERERRSYMRQKEAEARAAAEAAAAAAEEEAAAAAAARGGEKESESVDSTTTQGGTEEGRNQSEPVSEFGGEFDDGPAAAAAGIDLMGALARLDIDVPHDTVIGLKEEDEMALFD